MHNIVPAHCGIRPRKLSAAFGNIYGFGNSEGTDSVGKCPSADISRISRVSTRNSSLSLMAASANNSSV